MLAKFFNPMNKPSDSGARITLTMNFMSGRQDNYTYDYPYRSYDSIYYELQNDYHRNMTKKGYTIRFVGMVGNKDVNEVFNNFENFLSFLKYHDLMEKDLLEKREYKYINS